LRRNPSPQPKVEIRGRRNRFKTGQKFAQARSLALKREARRARCYMLQSWRAQLLATFVNLSPRCAAFHPFHHDTT